MASKCSSNFFNILGIYRQEKGVGDALLLLYTQGLTCRGCKIALLTQPVGKGWSGDLPI